MDRQLGHRAVEECGGFGPRTDSLTDGASSPQVTPVQQALYRINLPLPYPAYYHFLSIRNRTRGTVDSTLEALGAEILNSQVHRWVQRQGEICGYADKPQVGSQVIMNISYVDRRPHLLVSRKCVTKLGLAPTTKNIFIS